MIAILPSGKLIRLAVFNTPAQWKQGLVGIPDMPRDVGALFSFPEARVQTFWTFGCLFPLDIIWLDDEGRVVEIVSALPCLRKPCAVYGGSAVARYVLELNGGVAQQNGVVPGSQVALGCERRWFLTQEIV